MDTAEIRKIASLCKSEVVNKVLGGKHALGRAVHVIRRTEMPIRRARGATGDTVAASGPCPSHRIAHRDVDCARAECKRPTWRYRHIHNRAGCRWHAVYGWLAVLIDNIDALGGGLLLLPRRDAPVSGCSLR
jgi:hypothetical protein